MLGVCALCVVNVLGCICGCINLLLSGCLCVRYKRGVCSSITCLEGDSERACLRCKHLQICCLISCGKVSYFCFATLLLTHKAKYFGKADSLQRCGSGGGYLKEATGVLEDWGWQKTENTRCKHNTPL